jgi:tetratricopeptide (TPR) repeat protein
VSYDRALSIHNGLNIFDERQKTILIASIYHSLGMVAEAQRQWAQAEQYYQKALAIKIDFNDRHSQASTYHQLGRVAQEQRQWAQAEEYYQKALAIYIDFNDRYEQASTYHQLGMVAQAQRQWAQAEQYYHKALAIYIEFDDQYWAGNTVWRLAHLWQESGDNNLPGHLASWLGIAPAEAEELLRQRLEASSPQENTNSEASP